MTTSPTLGRPRTWLTLPQAADQIGWHPQTLRKLIRKEKLLYGTHYRDASQSNSGRPTYQVNAAAVESWLELTPSEREEQLAKRTLRKKVKPPP